MRAERLALTDLLRSAESLGKLSERIADGAVFVYPTETIYGIGGRCDRDEVRQRIVAAKRRPPGAPMILMAARREAFAFLGVRFPPVAVRMADTFWPGNLTLVLPSTRGEVGVRVSGHPFVAALAPHFGIPLYSTSANVSGETYDGSPEAVYALFEGAVDFVVDAGELPPSPPSTVVRVEPNGTWNVLREGAIDRADLESAVRRVP
jgi:L-threonylcarbamoyladenylate synthase